jgi:hypothetical protein
VKAGGLPLVFGMTIFAGVIEAVLARALHRLRALVPVELSGLVILLIGMTAGLVGVRTLLGGDARAPSGAEWTDATVTLGITIVLNIGSSLVFGTLVALAFNLLFRIGVRQTVEMSLRADAHDPAKVEEFLHRNGARWGARPDIVNRVVFGADQLIEAVIEHGHASGALELQARFDEFDFELRLSYEGAALELPEQRPSAQEIRDTDAGAMRLAGFLLRRNADRVQVEQQGSRVAIWFHFDH